jgi:serine/threonine protein kinase
MLGSYKVVARLGEGGMGAVYLAEHQAIGRKAAIKVLHPQFAAQPRVVERFFNEARAANQIHHPGIVEIFDLGQEQEIGVYLVMELLEGESLHTRLKRRLKLPCEEVASLVSRVAGAVGAAHARGIIHRDLKPDNVFVLPDPDHPSRERVKVLDFGIAKLEAEGGAGTRTGAVLGTPAYMSPEQCHGAKHVDARADIYSLGIITYEALTGALPFQATGFGELVAKHMYAPPPPLRDKNPAVPPTVEAVVLKALAKEPELRQQSMEEFADTLVRVTQESGAPAYQAVPLPKGTLRLDDGKARPSNGSRPSRPPSGVPAAAASVGSLPPAASRRGSGGSTPSELLDGRPTTVPGAKGSTLSSGAAEMAAATPPARGGRRWWLAGVGAIVALAAGGTVALVMGSGEDAEVSDATAPRAKRTGDAERAPITGARAHADDRAPDASRTAEPPSAGTDAPDAPDPFPATAETAETSPSFAPGTADGARRGASSPATFAAVLDGAKRRMAACGKGTPIIVAVTFEIDDHGTARKIVPEAPYTWSDEGTCVTRVLARLKFPVHSGPPLGVRRTYTVGTATPDKPASAAKAKKEKAPATIEMPTR